MEKKILDRKVKPLCLEKSFQMYNKTKEMSPGGALGMRSPESSVYGEYPIFIEKAASGMHIIDVDGNEYIDFFCGFGPIILDYVEEEVNNAVMDRMKKGFCFAAVQPDKLKLEEKLKEIIPCCEKTLIGKSGSDVTAMAVRLARAYTGRNKIINHGYRGWHDWSNYDRPNEKSIPKQIGELTIPIPWGDLNHIEQILSNDKDVAAIFISPILHELSMPIRGSAKYLKGLRELADKYNVVLIFDEVRTGFRIALGGAQEFYGIIPDLGCFAKALGNGYAIGVLCGKKDIMDMAIDKAFITATYFQNSLEIVASLKTIEIIERDGVIGNIRDKSIYFKNECDRITSKYTNVRAYYATDLELSCLPLILFEEQEKIEEKRNYFFSYLIRKGIFMHPTHNNFIAFRHTKKDIDYTLEVIEEALAFLDKQYQ